MTREEKSQFVVELSQKFKTQPNFYVLDMGGMTVSESNAFRARLFKEKYEVHMAKNSLIRKALEAAGVDPAPMAAALKQSSSIIFAGENANAPAKLLKDYLGNKERPSLKGAFIEQTAFVGGDKLVDTLASLKSKDELIGEIIGLLQSPMSNVVSALQSGRDTLGGLMKALEERAA
jgi:large subunit ribosomal protein L10